MTESMRNIMAAHLKGDECSCPIIETAPTSDGEGCFDRRTVISSAIESETIHFYPEVSTWQQLQIQTFSNLET
jgi:hypothetical protein